MSIWSHLVRWNFYFHIHNYNDGLIQSNKAQNIPNYFFRTMLSMSVFSRLRRTVEDTSDEFGCAVVKIMNYRSLACPTGTYTTFLLIIGYCMTLFIFLSMPYRDNRFNFIFGLRMLFQNSSKQLENIWFFAFENIIIIENINRLYIVIMKWEYKSIH